MLSLASARRLSAGGGHRGRGTTATQKSQRRFGARRVPLASGHSPKISVPVTSAALNFLFGFSTALGMMMVLWGLNGYFQAMGWSPSVKTLANWFPPERRGKMAGLYASSYQMGNVAAWLLGGYLVHYGWRYVFWVPAGLFLLSAIHCRVRVRNAPEDIGLPAIEEYSRGEVRQETEGDRYLGLRYTLLRTVGSSQVWRAGLAYLFMSVVAYGLLYWIPTYLSAAVVVVVVGTMFVLFGPEQVFDSARFHVCPLTILFDHTAVLDISTITQALVF